MSSERPSAGRSPTPDLALASLVRLRGAPLLAGLEEHLPGAREHAEGSGSYAFAAAVALELGRAGSELCRETAKLHEIGKVYVPADVLAKAPTDRTPEDQALYDGHWEAGARLALGGGLPDDVCGWLLQARERFDGGGPEGLAGSAIPIASRITRAASLCDRLLAAPGLSPAVRRDAAIGELRARAGSELDPDVAEALVSVLERSSY